MTTTEPKPQYVTEFVTVEQMIPDVPGRDGLQTELHLTVSFSRYPVKFWIPKDLPPHPKRGDQRWVTLQRGTLKEGRDPSAEYNYRWYIYKWDVEKPEGLEVPYSGELEATYKNNDIFTNDKASPKNTMPIWPGSTEQRIAWNSGVNNAIAYLSANPLVDKEGAHIRYDDPLWDTEFNYLAHKLYASIANGPDLDRWGPFIEDSTPDPEPEPEPEPEPAPAVTSSEELP